MWVLFIYLSVSFVVINWRLTNLNKKFSVAINTVLTMYLVKNVIHSVMRITLIVKYKLFSKNMVRDIYIGVE